MPTNWRKFESGKDRKILVLPLGRQTLYAARAAGLFALFSVLPLAALWLFGADILPASAVRPVLPDRVVRSFDTVVADDMTNCDIPGWPDSIQYGEVPEEDLPWYYQEPVELRQLRQQLSAHRLAAAFQITVKDPLFDELHNVAHGAQLLAGSSVQPGEVFSLNARAGPYSAARGYKFGPTYIGGTIVPTEGGGVCKIGTALYNTAQLAGLTVVERHAHSMMVPYVPPGRDAAIAYGAKDVRFQNDSGYPIIIWSRMVDQTLFVAFYSQYEPPAVEWHHEVLSQEDTTTIRRPNSELAPNEERVIIGGYPGLTVQTWITVTYPGEEPQRQDLGIDSYRPMPRVVEFGPQ